MKDLDARIEAAADILSAMFRMTTHAPERDARDIIATAFPELFTDPPTAWIAPWEATEVMQDSWWDNFNTDDVPTAYRAMRDVHIGKVE